MMKPLLSIVALLMLVPLTLGCGGSESHSDPAGEAGASAGGSAGTAESPSAAVGSGTIDFSEADLDLYERGIAKEVELVKAARDRAAGGGSPEERAAASDQWESQSVPAAARAAGIPEDRYRFTREAVHEVFQTLDFQGKIDGPLSMDMTRASPEVRERLAKDPFDALSPTAASALRARMDRLVPVWIEYVNLTAVAG